MVKKLSMKFCYTIVTILFLFVLTEVVYAAEAQPRPEKIASCNETFFKNLGLFKKMFQCWTTADKFNAIKETKDMTYKEMKIFLDANPSVDYIASISGIGRFFVTTAIDLYWKNAEYEQRERHALHDQELKEITTGLDTERQLLSELSGVRRTEAIDYIERTAHLLIDKNMLKIALDKLKSLSKTTKNEKLKDIYDLVGQFDLDTNISTYDRLFLSPKDYAKFIDRTFDDVNCILDYIDKIMDSPNDSAQLVHEDFVTITNFLIPILFKRSKDISELCLKKIETMHGTISGVPVLENQLNLDRVQLMNKSLNRRLLFLADKLHTKASNLKGRSIQEKSNPNLLKDAWNSIKRFMTSEAGVSAAVTASHVSSTVQNVAVTGVIVGVGVALIYKIISSTRK